MIFFLCNALGYILHLLVIQVIYVQAFSTICYISTGFHFIDSVCYHSNDFINLQVFKFKLFENKFFKIKSFNMPIVTRSMAKHCVSGNAQSESFIANSWTMNLENTINLAIVSTSSNDTSLSSFLSLPVGSPSVIIENQFEISNALYSIGYSSFSTKFSNGVGL